MPELSGLTLRQHERRSIELAVEFLIADEHRKQVRFSSTSAAPGPTLIRGSAVDISTGGLGLVLDQFVPKMCEGTVRVFGPTPVGKGHDGSLLYDVVFDQRVKVRRARMHSHAPNYAIGVSFVDVDPDLEVRVEELQIMASQKPRGAAHGDA